jgi:hypothetical protein
MSVRSRTGSLAYLHATHIERIAKRGNPRRRRGAMSQCWVPIMFRILSAVLRRSILVERRKLLAGGVIAQHPQITQVALRERLKDDGLALDRWYVASLLKEIADGSP